MVRWTIEAPIAERTRCRGCQRSEIGSRRRDRLPRRRLRHGRFVADVNVPGPVSMVRQAIETTATARTLHRNGMCRRRGRGSAMGCRGRTIWRECPFAAVNALRKAPGGKGSRGQLFFSSIRRFLGCPAAGRPVAGSQPPRSNLATSRQLHSHRYSQNSAPLERHFVSVTRTLVPPHISMAL